MKICNSLCDYQGFSNSTSYKLSQIAYQILVSSHFSTASKCTIFVDLQKITTQSCQASPTTVFNSRKIMMLLFLAHIKITAQNSVSQGQVKWFMCEHILKSMLCKSNNRIPQNYKVRNYRIKKKHIFISSQSPDLT